MVSFAKGILVNKRKKKNIVKLKLNWTTHTLGKMAIMKDNATV